MNDNKKTKICSRKDCQFANIEQDISNFGFKNKKKGRYRSECKLCRNSDERKAFQKETIIKIDDIKMKICGNKDCKFTGIEQDISNFSFRNKKKRKYNAECKLCLAIRNVQYREDHKEEKAEYMTQYYQDNKEEKAEYNLQYYEDNKEDILIKTAQYREDHKEEISKKDRERKKKRCQNDPVFKLRQYVSNSIYCSLIANGSSKKGKSILKYLPYTIKELKTYIESLFSHPKNLHNGKAWMTWDNQGKYIKTDWNKNDSSTWKWQLDHETPHSTFKYKTMDCQEFRDCWALTNLRPYRADLNVKDGDRRGKKKTG